MSSNIVDWPPTKAELAQVKAIKKAYAFEQSMNEGQPARIRFDVPIMELLKALTSRGFTISNVGDVIVIHPIPKKGDAA